ncbi:MAG: gliding motility-associated C-terminal domain-containing protein [Bacteroidota bacterium]
MKNLFLICFVLIAGSAFAQNNTNLPKDTCTFVLPNVITAGSYERIHFSTNCNCIEFKIEIYNRWGEKMYVQENLNNYELGWNVDKVENGTYVWMIIAKFIGDSEVFEVKKTGTISVMK